MLNTETETSAVHSVAASVYASTKGLIATEYRLSGMLVQQQGACDADSTLRYHAETEVIYTKYLFSFAIMFAAIYNSIIIQKM